MTPILPSVAYYTLTPIFLPNPRSILQYFKTGAVARMSANFLADSSDSKLDDSHKLISLRVLQTPHSAILVKSFSVFSLEKLFYLRLRI